LSPRSGAGRSLCRMSMKVSVVWSISRFPKVRVRSLAGVRQPLLRRLGKIAIVPPCP
jgi:hypothetical protein